MGLVKARRDGDSEFADDHFETSLAVFEMLDNEHELAKTHAAYGESLLDRGRDDAAAEHLQAALEEFCAPAPSVARPGWSRWSPASSR